MTAARPIPIARGRGRARTGDWRFGALVIGLAVVLCVFGRFAGTDPDEEYALASTAHGLAYALHRAIFYELQAPLWFGIMALWRAIDPSVWFARVFSIACAIGLCYALRDIARRIRPRADPFPFVALVAFNPFFIYAALEVRVYAFALLLSALTWIAFFDGFLAGHDRRAQWRFALLTLASIYTFYYLGFVVAGAGLALLVTRRRALAAFAPIAVALCVASLPALFAIKATFGDVRAALPASAGFPARSFFDPLLLFGLPTSYRWGDVPILAAALHVYKLLVVAGFVALVALRPRLSRTDLAVVCFALGTWAAYPLVYPFVHVRFEMPRHYVAVFVPFAAALYAVLSAGSAPWRRLLLGAFVAVYAALCAATLAANYGPLSKAGDMRRMGSFLEQHATAQDVVAVFAPDAEPALRRFYDGPAHITAYPRESDPEHYATSQYEVHSVAEAADAIRRVADGKHLWLVIYGRCTVAAENYGCPFVHEALREQFPGSASTEFYEGEVVEVAGRP
jgi:hypothetical protein